MTELIVLATLVFLLVLNFILIRLKEKLSREIKNGLKEVEDQLVRMKEILANIEKTDKEGKVAYEKYLAEISKTALDPARHEVDRMGNVVPISNKDVH